MAAVKPVICDQISPLLSRLCSPSLENISDPVIDPCGHTFDKKDILQWLATHNICPVSNLPLRVNDLIPNVIVREGIEALKRMGNPLNGRVEEQVLNENDRLILLRAMQEFRLQILPQQASNKIECSMHIALNISLCIPPFRKNYIRTRWPFYRGPAEW
ncbi:MAG TPA: U-box domain-containing protein [Candidatus Babeliaceae bacterium]|nr:U-box domain-containing protein [Candidatus Babeliaceae bacterium]